MKLKSITTEIIQLPTEDNGNQCITKAIATTEDGKLFEGFGDADPSNVNSMITKHLIRMAETRAKARALRDLTNVGMTAIEELGGEEETPTKYKPNMNQSDSNLKCSECNAEINKAVQTFSLNKYKKELCFECQRKEN